jgi:ribonucleoside-diphosphate reductase alpha chain
VSLNTDYQKFIHKSRYARWLGRENRRENWDETVDRYMEFMRDHLKSKHNYTVADDLYNDLRRAIYELHVVPSMRALMTAGPALARDNTAGYNCSYLPVDSPRSFDEALYILMCGTGVGYSVEQKYVAQLPTVPKDFNLITTSIAVEDSKAGWADALRKLIEGLYSGIIFEWDVSQVRPAGARLKTFGGRASGPDPLVELFKFVIEKFVGARGRRLTSLECHDILCKIGEVVVVGGVRRSAMISLSDLGDSTLQGAKSGEWWKTNPERALANNSAVYDTKPDVGTFMQEWLHLYRSFSGERGIFNREASKAQAARNGRRNTDHEFGTNPCSEIILRPYQFCNLSEVVVRENDTQLDLEWKVRMATILGTFQSTLTDFAYLRPVWKSNTEEERLLGVSLTGILDSPLLSRASYEDWDGNMVANADLPKLLDALRTVAVYTNARFADHIGIPRSTAVTCVKPSGTVSQLVDTASGIHPRFAPYYIRRVRQDKKDPLTAFLMDSGVPVEDCVLKPTQTAIFSFPMKAPANAVFRDYMSAIEQLELWLIYAKHWCEHKPSITVYVREDEWPKVGAWVYDHFDDISGVSFLPYDNGTYQQAPYEEIDRATYERLAKAMPTTVKWDDLAAFEFEDNTEGVQMLACVSGHCEI